MFFCVAFSPNYVLLGDVGHALEFHQMDNPHFGFGGDFECNPVRSLVPESILVYVIYRSRNDADALNGLTMLGCRP